MAGRILKLIVITFLILFVIFYFWASSASLQESEYHTINRFSPNLTFDKTDTISIMSYNIGYLSGMTNNLPIERTKEIFDDSYKIAKSLLEHEFREIIWV